MSPLFTIAKRFDFSASHVLEGLPEGHQCGRLHGHNYGVELVLEADTLDRHGFVVDYGDLAIFRAFIDDTLDHRHLNEVLINNPTAEHLAAYLCDAAVGFGFPVVAVRVSETPKTWAEYRPAPPPLPPGTNALV